MSSSVSKASLKIILTPLTSPLKSTELPTNRADFIEIPLIFASLICMVIDLMYQAETRVNVKPVVCFGTCFGGARDQRTDTRY